MFTTESRRENPKASQSHILRKGQKEQGVVDIKEVRKSTVASRRKKYILTLGDLLLRDATSPKEVVLRK